MSSISRRHGRQLPARYAANKAAVIRITQSAVLALAPYNIKVNASCPSVVPTVMWKQIPEDHSTLFGTRSGESMAPFISSIPIKRPSTIEHVSAALASPCSIDLDCITGKYSMLMVDLECNCKTSYSNLMLLYSKSKTKRAQKSL